MKTNQLKQRAIKKAMQSQCRFKVSAIGFDHNGNYLGSSVNAPRFDKFSGGLHAEMRLFARYGKNLKTVFICRVGNTGLLLPIDPCSTCASKAKELGIKIKTIGE
jgi:tRNA(Arg) A34 adenosine deaminase TadA